MEYILSYDLGTGGVKTSLFDEKGNCIKSAFGEYNTYYEKQFFQEQSPNEWWNQIIVTTQKLLKTVDIDKNSITAIGLSGHSLGVVAIDSTGELIFDKTPIWSDSRAEKQAGEFFSKVNEKEWYMKTGSGFPPHLYSIFKIMWYKDNFESEYEKAKVFFGTKDYINYLLTGVVVTDYSYASGCGVYSLEDKQYIDEYLSFSGVDKKKLPTIVNSDEVLGNISQKAAQTLGLPKTVKVVAGGVDNACMALGSNCFKDGEAYLSLGTSAWIAVSNQKPILDFKKKPYVFAHCVGNQTVSATAIFSAGRSLKWIKDVICANLEEVATQSGQDMYVLMDELAKTSPIGSNRLLFNPSLSGGSSSDHSVNLRGSFIGLDLMHTQSDLIRATLEGICINLKIVLDILGEFVPINDEILIVGGGAKSRFWCSLFADIFQKTIITSTIGQDAGALGAAALAAHGCGVANYNEFIECSYKNKTTVQPNKENYGTYEKLTYIFQESEKALSNIGDIYYKKND